MRKARIFSALAAILLPLTLPAGSDSPAVKAVLVELFTSQGCSSCPPAERVLAELKAEAENGARIVPLGFHVDYWDGIGWKDPYSSNSHTTRQALYGRIMKLRNVYTPQTVVDGAYEMLGSNRAKIMEAARIRAAIPAAYVLQISVKSSEAAKAKIRVRVDPENIPAKKTQPGAKWVYAATYIPEATTSVRSGENAGRSIRQVNLVRAVAEPAPFKPDGAPREFEFDLPYSPGDGVAAWIQDHRTFTVDQAAIWNRR